MGAAAGQRMSGDVESDFRSTEDALSTIMRWSLYRFHAELAEESGLRIDRSTISILTRLFNVGTTRVSDLADHLGLERSTVSRQVAATVAAGYVARIPDESDARAYILEMTELGRRTITAVREAKTRVIARIIEEMSASEAADVARVLPALSRAMEAASRA